MDMSENIISVVVNNIFPLLDERCHRLLAGSLAIGYGYGGQKLVCHYSNLSRQTLCKAVAELKIEGEPPCVDKSRRSGAGRKDSFEKHPGLIDFIDSILQENTYGNPMSVIAYSSLSLRDIANEVSARIGIRISQNIVSKALDMLGYSKQKNQKMEQLGEPHPDRDAQFRHINKTGAEYIADGAPVISVDCKKKENVGNFKNNGQEYRCRTAK